MGAPLNTSELKSPTVAEALRVLTAGSELAQELNLKKLSRMLEEMRLILQPLVLWLDKPISSVGWVRLGSSMPAHLQKKRIMPLFDGSGYGESPSFGLQRSGTWFVAAYEPNYKITYHEANSEKLARLIIRNGQAILAKSLQDSALAADFPKELNFLKEAALYSGILTILSACAESVARLLREREERMRIARERLHLLTGFIQSLDPLSGQDQTVSLPEHSIWSVTSQGSSRDTADYLCPEALVPFWDHLKSRGNAFGYRPESVVVAVKSLPQFIHIVAHLMGEISRIVKEDKADAAALFGKQDGRLPFTSQELEVLKKIFESITHKPAVA